MFLFFMVLPPVGETPGGQTAAMVRRELPERCPKRRGSSKRRRRSWSRGSSRSRGRSRMALAAIGLLLAGCTAQADEVGAALAYRIARPYQRAYRDLLGYAERCQSKVAFAIDPDLGQAEVEVFLRTLIPFHRWRFEFSRVTATTSLLVTRTVWAGHDSATRSFVAAAQGQIPPCPFP